MYDDPAADQPPSASADPVDGAVAAAPEHVRSQLPGWERTTTDPVCPFLRASTAGDALGEPIETPDPANRCTALHDAVPQSLRQQELVCLSSAHVNCPRYLRGAVGLPAPVEPVVRGAPGHARHRWGAGAVRARLRHLGRVRRRHRGPDADRRRPDRDAGWRRPRRGRDRAADRSFRRPSPRRQPTPAPTPSPSPSPSPSPTPTAAPTPTPIATRRTDHQGHAAPDLEPLRAVEALPGHARLLHLHRSLGRQPVQHREVLRRPAQDGPGDEPVDQERPRGRARAEDPDAHSLGRVGRGRPRAATASRTRAGRRRSPKPNPLTPTSTDSILTWRDSHPRMHRSGTKW